MLCLQCACHSGTDTQEFNGVNLAPDVKSVATPKSVLFIGNSFTYFNGGVDQHLRKLVASDNPGELLEIGSHVVPSQTFSGHHSDPNTEDALRQQSWDIVVLQAASYEPIGVMSKSSFRENALLLAGRVDEIEAAPVMFMTWAYRNSPGMTAPLRNAYVEIGNEIQALVVPVGLAWEQVLRERTNSYLFSDRKHPSLYGTYLAACVFYASLFGKSPEGLQYTGDIPASEAQFLQRIAWTTVAEFYNNNI